VFAGHLGELVDQPAPPAGIPGKADVVRSYIPDRAVSQIRSAVEGGGRFGEHDDALPVGHVGETEEIAHAYLYCMTQTFATGSILTVDGGTVLV
jgi:NAD(P)-dependent dehydrogenase (short-subunit alcohol dehydrogenase family)